jgi:N-methylhydantoinase B
VLGHEATFLGTLERQRVAPFGLSGGAEGGRGALILNAGTSDGRDLGSKIAGLRLAPGDRVTIITPGAGGYGAAAERDPQLLARDIRDGKTTRGAFSPGENT